MNPSAPELHDEHNRIREHLAEPKPAAPPPIDASGRDVNGRFAKGNLGGPGNPFARKVAQLRSVILEELDATRMRTIVRRLLEMAEEGDVAAARLLFSYGLGKPAKSADPDRVDVDEWQLNQEKVATAKEILHVFSHTSVRQANAVAPIMFDVAEKRFAKGYKEGPAAVAEQFGEDPEDWADDDEPAEPTARPSAGDGEHGPTPAAAAPSTNPKNPEPTPGRMPQEQPLEPPPSREELMTMFADMMRRQRDPARPS